jgi:hypothetical protein
LAIQTDLSGESFGTAGHPFGAAVRDPGDDLRLAAAAMTSVDFDTCMVFDLIVTNRRIYAVYERLPFTRSRYGPYAAFSYTIPVATRAPHEWHALKIAYDKIAGTVLWFVNDREVFPVTRLGRRIDKQYPTLDHGGVEADVSPNQLDGGLGLFTLLDGYRPSNQALVRLSTAEGFYASSGTGHVAAPGAGYFRDEQSAPAVASSVRGPSCGRRPGSCPAAPRRRRKARSRHPATDRLCERAAGCRRSGGGGGRAGGVAHSASSRATAGWRPASAPALAPRAFTARGSAPCASSQRTARSSPRRA